MAVCAGDGKWDWACRLLQLCVPCKIKKGLVCKNRKDKIEYVTDNKVLDHLRRKGIYITETGRMSDIFHAGLTLLNADGTMYLQNIFWEAPCLQSLQVGASFLRLGDIIYKIFQPHKKVKTKITNSVFSVSFGFLKNVSENRKTNLVFNKKVRKTL